MNDETPEYQIVRHKTQGYALFKKARGFWQQVSPWYLYRAYAVKRFEEAKEAAERAGYKPIL